MQIRADIREDATTLKVRGFLDDDGAAELEKALEALERHGFGNFVLDLQDVAEASEEGLRSLMERRRRESSTDGRMTVLANGPIRRLFRALGAEDLFEVCENVINTHSNTHSAREATT
jgi:anti-anti-sigma factor